MSTVSTTFSRVSLLMSSGRTSRLIGALSGSPLMVITGHLASDTTRSALVPIIFFLMLSAWLVPITIALALSDSAVCIIVSQSLPLAITQSKSAPARSAFFVTKLHRCSFSFFSRISRSTSVKNSDQIGSTPLMTFKNVSFSFRTLFNLTAYFSPNTDLSEKSTGTSK